MLKVGKGIVVHSTVLDLLHLVLWYLWNSSIMPNVGHVCESSKIYKQAARPMAEKKVMKMAVSGPTAVVDWLTQGTITRCSWKYTGEGCDVW